MNDNTAAADADEHAGKVVAVLFDMDTMERCLYWALRNALRFTHAEAEEWAHTMSCANCNRKARPSVEVGVVAQTVAATLAQLKDMGKLGDDTVREADGMHQAPGTTTKQ